MDTIDLFSTTVDTSELAHVFPTGDIFITANILLIIATLLVAIFIILYYVAFSDNTQRFTVVKDKYQKIIIVSFAIAALITVISTSIITVSEMKSADDGDKRISFYEKDGKLGLWETISDDYFQALDSNQDKLDKYSIDRACRNQEKLYSEKKSILCHGNSLKSLTTNGGHYTLTPTIKDEDDRDITHSFVDDYEDNILYIDVGIAIKDNYSPNKYHKD